MVRGVWIGVRGVWIQLICWSKRVTQMLREMLLADVKKIL